jgi:hypothetical protein
MLRSSGAQAELTNSDRAEEIESLAYALGLAQARAQTRAMEIALERMEKNVNLRLLAEVTLMDLPQVR